jgi:hypothetical protein
VLTYGMVEWRTWHIGEKLLFCLLGFIWLIVWSNFILTVVIRVETGKDLATFLFTIGAGTLWFVAKFTSFFVGLWGVLELVDWIHTRRKPNLPPGR